MSNWQYANLVPTKSWRSAMTIPRDLSVKHVGNEIFIVSKPMPELNSLKLKQVSLQKDDGLSVMTEIFFPNKPYNHIEIESPDGVLIKKMDFSTLKSIWQ